MDAPVDDLVVIDSAGRRMFVQAKADSNLNRALRDTVQQWVTAVQEGHLNDGDILVLASPPSRELQNFREALNRRRDRLAEEPSMRQVGAITTLEDYISAECDPCALDEVTGQVLDRAVIWEIDGISDGAPAPSAAISMLSMVMDKPDDAELCFSAFRTAVVDRARLRSGIDVPRILAIASKFSLQSTNLNRIALRLAAIERYRSTLEAKARYLPVVGLAADIPPIPVPDLLRHLWVSLEPYSDDIGIYVSPVVIPFQVAARRLGRVLLLGAPGAGKTTALIHLAASLARETTAPLPVVIRLQDLAAPWREGETVKVDNESIAATMQTDGISDDERQSLVDEVRTRLRRGDIAVLLDGLDELGTLRSDAAHALRSWIDSLPLSVRVLVTSRDTTYASAQVLGLRSCALGRPSNLEDTIREVLRRASTWRGRPDPELTSEQWYQRHVAWLRVVETHWALLDVPLYAMQIAVLAASTRLAELPSSNAQALRAVVRSVWNRWETGQRRRGRPPLPGLSDPDSSAEAMWSTFSLIAHELFDGGVPREQLIEKVSNHLQQEYGLPPGVARAGARQLLEIWDEAGLFIASGRQAIVLPVARLLVEVGLALHASKLNVDEQTAWVREHLTEPEDRELLLLAAGLDKAIRDQLIALATREDDVRAAVLVTNAYKRDRGWSADEDVYNATETLVNAALHSSLPEALPAMLTLVHMPLMYPELTHLLIVDAAPRLPVGWCNVVLAIAASTWPIWQSVDEADNGIEQLELPITGLLPRLPMRITPVYLGALEHSGGCC
ncbi:UNVERIFIED_ORG: adenylate kinase family enzyme [Microbispora rosea subsp. rosea]